MKKGIILRLIAAMLLILGIVSSVWAENGNLISYDEYTSFRFYISSVDQGYNSTARNKTKGFSHAYCTVLNTMIPTNFLVIASDDKQISENHILTKGSGLGMLRYYSTDHESAVRLRVNSGSTTVKYAVTGQWDPNGIVFCP